MTHHPNPDPQPATDDHRPPQPLDPDHVDESCQIVDVPMEGGGSVTVSLRTVAPLTGPEEALLGDVVQAVAARMERERPHAGVVQELMLAWSQLRIQPGLLGAEGHVGAVKDRVSAAIRAVRAALDATQAELADHQREYGEQREELTRLRATIREVTDLLALPRQQVTGATAPSPVDLARWARAALDSWQQRLADIQGEMAKHLEVHERELGRARAELVRAQAEERAERESRFRWAEEAARLETDLAEAKRVLAQGVQFERYTAAERDLARWLIAEARWQRDHLHAELEAAVTDLRSTTELAARLVPLLGAATLTDAQKSELEEIATGLLPPRVSAPVSVIVDRATGDRHEYPQSNVDAEHG